MKHIFKYLLLCAAFLTAASAQAFSIDEADLADALSQYMPPAPDGAVSWHTLGKATEKFDEQTGEISVIYPNDVKPLDGQIIKIKGFMFPLEADDKSTHFLFTALPPSCPFCLPAGPSYAMDVHTKTPIAFTYDALFLEGQLQLLHGQGEQMLYYQLNAAEVIE